MGMSTQLQPFAPLPPTTRMHVAIGVRDLEAALPFYRTLFGTDPTKLRPRYAKFEVLDPPVNFTLNQTDHGAVGQADPQHFGVQVRSPEAVSEAHARLTAAGIATETEDGVTCCWAVQDKVWARDPDGHRWEVFVVTDPDAPVHGRQEDAAEDKETCCDPGCCQ